MESAPAIATFDAATAVRSDGAYSFFEPNSLFFLLRKDHERRLRKITSITVTLECFLGVGFAEIRLTRHTQNNDQTGADLGVAHSAGVLSVHLPTHQDAPTTSHLRSKTCCWCCCGCWKSETISHLFHSREFRAHMPESKERKVKRLCRDGCVGWVRVHCPCVGGKTSKENGENNRNQQDPGQT